MKTVQTWVTALCFAAGGCTLLEMLYPNGTMRRAARLLVALFFLGVLLFPLRNFSWDTISFDLSDSEPDRHSENLQKTLEEQSVQVVEETVRQVIAEKLAQNGVSGTKIFVRAEQRAEGVSVQSVRILVPEEHIIQVQRFLQELQITGEVEGI